MSHQPDNISAGTQVVALIETRGPNQVVGASTRGGWGGARKPTGTELDFLVRFPDGFEQSLTAEQLQVLKPFKDRLQGPNSDQPDFDLKSVITTRCVMVAGLWLGNRRVRC